MTCCHRSNPIPFCISRLISVVMSSSMLGCFLEYPNIPWLLRAVIEGPRVRAHLFELDAMATSLPRWPIRNWLIRTIVIWCFQNCTFVKYFLNNKLYHHRRFTFNNVNESKSIVRLLFNTYFVLVSTHHSTYYSELQFGMLYS